MDSDEDTACAVGCPIRRSRDQRSLASPPGFSQRATSFIASQCQGIHQMPLLALERHTQRQRPFRSQSSVISNQNHSMRQTLLSEDTAGSSHGLTAARSPATVTQLASLRLSISKMPRASPTGDAGQGMSRTLLAASQQTKASF